MSKGEFHKLSHAVAFAGSEHIVVGLGLLHDQPHAFDIVARMAPVPPGVQVAEIEFGLLAQLDGRHSAADLAGHEGLATDGALVIE
jgi:hypothetical protein